MTKELRMLSGLGKAMVKKTIRNLAISLAEMFCHD